MHRSRLDAVATRLHDHRLLLVVAPAGAGKTTLLSQLASAAPGPVAWYRADAGDAKAPAVLAHLERAFADAIPSLASGWSTTEDAVAAVEAYDGPPALLAVDDLHALFESPGEAALEWLIDNLPSTVAVMAASRRAPAFNLSRLRVADEVLELTSEDLRFRPWEVEVLFRDFYNEPLLPEELAELARRTDGWAAGLQLFHLATSGKSAQERRRVLAAMASRTHLVRDYLTANVIDELAPDLRRFLLDTCVLGRLNAELCDAVRDSTGSAAWLAELDERQMFVQVGEDGTYRYHEVLRSHLEAVLVGELGEEAVRSRHAEAGRLLESAGALPEALRAYCRAESWAAVTRLLGGSGERAITDNAGWLEVLPGGLIEHDPWLLLATARRYVADGDWRSAVHRYQQAEAGFGGSPASQIARRERQAVASWSEAVPLPPADWSGTVRLATRREPQAARHRAAALEGASGLLAAGLAALLSGAVRDARLCLEAVAARSDVSDGIAAGAEIGAAAAALLAGRTAAESGIEAAADRADRLGMPALAWLGRTVAQLDPVMAMAGAGPSPQVAGWGSALDDLLMSLGDIRAGRAPVDRLDAAIAGFRRLGAGTLEAWARSAHAIAAARAGEPDARDTALAAEGFARSTGVQGALALAYAALAEADPGRRGEFHALRRVIEDECGLDVAGLASGSATGSYDALAPGAVTAGPLVGRAKEVAQLRLLVDAACAGRGSVATVGGDSGIGKTRLAEEVALYAASVGATVLWGRGMDAGPPFWPWAQLLRTHLLGHDLDAVVEEVNGDLDALSLVVPELGELLGGNPARQQLREGGAVARFTVFRAITAVLERATARQPVVVILDDFHWADASSASLLGYVAKVLPELRLLVVVTRRTGGRAASGSPGTTHLALAGLSPDEVAQLLEHVAGRPPTADLAGAVWEKTAGNPFFVQETAKLLVSSGGFDNGTITDARQVPVTAGVHDLVMRRVTELPAVAVELLEAAAVAGGSFSAPLLERVTRMEAGVILEAIGEAVAMGVVKETWAEAGQFGFAHALIQEALYDRLETVRRAHLHERVGVAIEAAAGTLVEPRLGEIAHHFLRAAPGGDAARAITYAIRAGEAATVNGAYDEAVRHCEAALALLDDAGLSDDDRAELLVTLGELRARRASLHDAAAATQLAEEAALIGRRVDRPDVVSRAETLLGTDLAAGRAAADHADGLPASAGSVSSSLMIRCLGGFQITVEGRRVDVSSLKPRHRSLLRLLASRAGRPIHREELAEALWPAEDDWKAAMRNLQVAVSSLRRLLEPDAARGHAGLVRRDGDSYLLALPADADVDLRDVDRAIEEGRDALAKGASELARTRLGDALAGYAGELLPEEGPAEWVVKARERLRLEVAEAAQLLAQLELDDGRPAEAAAAGTRGLQIDRFRDGLWRLVIAAYEEAGDAAAGAHARRDYDEVLHELGVG